MQVALVVYDGVLADECTAFRSVLGRLPGTGLLTVGSRRGHVAGPGGAQTVDATFDELDHPDIVVVPGGLGCERIAADPSLRRWLGSVAPTCRWVVGSSTGSVVLAAAGLLTGHEASTHWLAVGLLDRYGVEASGHRLSVTGNVVTCEGRVSAVDAAFTIVERCAGPGAVAAIHHQLLEHDVVPTCPRRWLRRLWPAHAPDGRRPPVAPPAAPPSPYLIELVEGAPRPRRRRHRPPS